MKSKTNLFTKSSEHLNDDNKTNLSSNTNNSNHSEISHNTNLKVFRGEYNLKKINDPIKKRKEKQENGEEKKPSMEKKKFVPFLKKDSKKQVDNGLHFKGIPQMKNIKMNIRKDIMKKKEGVDKNSCLNEKNESIERNDDEIKIQKISYNIKSNKHSLSTPFSFRGGANQILESMVNSIKKSNDKENLINEQQKNIDDNGYQEMEISNKIKDLIDKKEIINKKSNVSNLCSSNSSNFTCTISNINKGMVTLVYDEIIFNMPLGLFPKIVNVGNSYSIHIENFFVKQYKQNKIIKTQRDFINFTNKNKDNVKSSK